MFRSIAKVICIPLLLLCACGENIEDGYGDYDDEDDEDVNGEQNSEVGASDDKDASKGAGWDAQAKDAGKWSSWDAQASDAGAAPWTSEDASWGGGGKGDAGGGSSSWSDGGSKTDGGRDAGRADASAESCATLTYESFGRQFLTNYCVSCHGATNPREGIRLDSLNGAVMRKAGVKAQVLGGSMPQGNKLPSDADRMRFGQWIDCGPK